jgi:hypothetical protein
MWVVRALAQLVFRIVISAGIAIIAAGLWVLVSGGDFTRALRISFFLFGAVLLMLAGAGNPSTSSNRRLGWMIITPVRGNTIARWSAPRRGDPKLSASAVFVGSAAVLIALGLVV